MVGFRHAPWDPPDLQVTMKLHDLACIFANRRTGVLMRAPGHGSRLVARLSSDAHHPMQGHVQILRFVLSAPHPPSDHFVLNAPRHPLDRDATFRPHPRALILAPLARAETSSATHLWGAIGTGAHRVGNQKLKTNLYTLSIPCKLFFIIALTLLRRAEEEPGTRHSTRHSSQSRRTTNDVNVFDHRHMFQCVHPMHVRLYALPKPYVRQFQVPIHDVWPIMTT